MLELVLALAVLNSVPGFGAVLARLSRADRDLVVAFRLNLILIGLQHHPVFSSPHLQHGGDLSP